jgi:hypothetical protein
MRMGGVEQRMNQAGARKQGLGVRELNGKRTWKEDRGAEEEKVVFIIVKKAAR